nr:MAG TPA: hypothetical protein [Caudoviricetes sp.]
MSIEPITRLQRFLRVLADSSADMPEPLRNLEKCCCYACGHLDTRPELHTTLEKLIASVRDKSIVPPKPNTRLEKYVAAMAGVWDDELPEPITIADKILFEAASGDDVTLSGNPLILENCIGGKALKALHVYGKSTQDGTPSPDNPVPIVSAGDGGSITMKVTGKNLYHAAWTGHYSENGLLFTATSTTITIKGTTTKDTLFTKWLIYRDNPIPLDPNKRYTITPKKTGVMVYAYDEEGVGKFAGSNIPERSTGAAVYYQKEFKEDETIDFETSIQLEIGTEATEYEPYREQRLVLQTPNGLPGIPVKSGGNYTDPTGQQWVCDEVDLARGVRVKNTRLVDVSTCKITNAVNLQQMKRLSYLLNEKAQTFRTEAICNILPHKASFSTDNAHFYADVGNIFIFIPIDSEPPLEGECFVLYALDTPVETPLTEAEIAAYKALTTYAPTTVLQATDGAGLEATYKCNVRKAEKTINDLYAELTAELEA